MQASSSGPVARKLERTSVPGIFKRGNRYIVVFRDQTGAQRKRSARTLSEAKAIKAAATTDVRRGEYRTQSNVRFRDHYGPWIDTYQGRTSKGFRDTGSSVSQNAGLRRRRSARSSRHFGRCSPTPPKTD